MPTGYGIIPFPPLPAWVLLPFVSVWHLATDEHLLAMVFAAIDVGIAYWMLGLLPVRQSIRVLTSLFLGLGTVLWYAAAIGSTWFWAHIVAIGCLLLAIGLALSADEDAAEPEPLTDVAAAIRSFSLPGGWSTAALLCALARRRAGLDPSGPGRAGDMARRARRDPLPGRCGAGNRRRRTPRVLGPFAIAVIGRRRPAGAPAHQRRVVGRDRTRRCPLLALIAVLWWLGGREGSRVDEALSSIWTALFESRVAPGRGGPPVRAGRHGPTHCPVRLPVLHPGRRGRQLDQTRASHRSGRGRADRRPARLHVCRDGPAVQSRLPVSVRRGAQGLRRRPELQLRLVDHRYPLHTQNLGIMFAGMPRILPNFSSIWPGDGGTPLCVSSSVRGLFDQSCPLAIPEATGTSILLTSPAYLLAPLAWGPIRRRKIDRLTAGATIAVVAIAIVNLMHFSQGWVQFGYRFSKRLRPVRADPGGSRSQPPGRWWPVVLLLPAVLFLPLGLLAAAVLGVAALIAVRAGVEPGDAWHYGRLWPVVVLVALSIAVNFWGTLWGVILGLVTEWGRPSIRRQGPGRRGRHERPFGEGRPGSSLRRRRVGPLLGAVATLWLVVPTLAPGLISQAAGDSAEFQTVSWVLGTAHPTGYPSYVILGFIASHLLPFGDPAFRMNLLQALLAAGAVAGTVAHRQHLTGMRWIASRPACCS